MNALHGLLPPPVATPPLPLPGSAAVLDAAHLRRRARARRAAVSAGAGALTVAVAAAVALHPASGAERLRPARTPSPTTRPVPSSTPTTVARDDVAPVMPATTTAVRPPSTAAPRTTSTPVPTKPAVATITRTLVTDSGTDCAEQYRAPDLVLCDRVSGPTSLRPGEPATYVFEVCAGAGRDQTVDYPGTDEVKTWIEDTGGRQHWQNAPQQGGPGAHSVVIPAGHCLRYTVRWDGRDAAGEALPQGEYVFSAHVTTAGLTWGDIAQVWFTVS